jgi:hypothetical protein
MKPLLRKKLSGIQKKPHSDYAISKYGAEMEIWRGQQEGLDAQLNPGIIIGPDSKNRKRQILRRLLTDYGITPWEKEHSSRLAMW